MFKKLTVVTALSTTLLFGGALANNAEASANTGQSQASPGQPYTTYYTINGGWNLNSENGVQSFFNDFYKNHDNTKEQNNQKKSDDSNPKEDQSQPKQESQEQSNQQTSKPAQPHSEEKEAQSNQSDQGSMPQLSQYEQQVVDLTNQKRAENGLAPLKVDKELSRVAREKSNDMKANHYFDHTSPVYGSPFDMMESYGISYSSAGENIAKGQTSPEAVVDGWMNSEGHRANILNDSFTHIGVGFAEGNYWTQQFIAK